MLNKSKIAEKGRAIGRVPNGVFREIIKYLKEWMKYKLYTTIYKANWLDFNWLDKLPPT
jgi:hypothetical protein